MSAPLASLEAELRDRLALSFALEPLGDDRVAVLSPFTFDDGDRYPIVIEPVDGGWRLTDEGGTALHLSLGGVPYQQGNRAKLVERIAHRHGLRLDDWELSKASAGFPSADDVLGFVHAVSRVSDVEFLARETVASTFLDDFRDLLGRLVRDDALAFDHTLDEYDRGGDYAVDVAMFREPRPPLFGFAVNSDTRAKDATIALLRFEGWRVRHESLVVFEQQEDLGRRTLARLSDVAGKQFATLRGNEDRLRQYLRDQEVPLAEAA